MKILITGSRVWDKPDAIKAAMSPYRDQTVELIHGGAEGADLMAGIIARSYGWTETRVDADWDTYGKEAGALRNLAMLDLIPHIVIAFIKGDSPGTRHCYMEAERRNIAVRKIRWEEC